MTAQSTTRIRVAASTPGSYWWEIGIMLQRALNRHGVKAKLDPATFDIHNVRAVADGRCTLGITMPPYLDWATRRIGTLADYPGPEPLVIAAINQPVWIAAAADRSTEAATLGGLISLGLPWRPLMPKEDTLLAAYVDGLLELHGSSRAALADCGGGWVPPYGNVRPSTITRVDPAQEANGLFFHVSWTVQWARDLSTRRDLRFLHFEEAHLDTLAARLGAQKLRMPHRLFPGVDEDITTLGWTQQYIYGTSQTDPLLVRQVIQALDQAGDDLLLNAQGHSYTPGREPRLIPGVRLHPAASDYYRTPRSSAES
ncbi:MAG: hypothetical protein J2P29_00875 [Actinobacteria bacterium]|nr:hypothetical protein [Actinomycetota bacterium]